MRHWITSFQLLNSIPHVTPHKVDRKGKNADRSLREPLRLGGCAVTAQRRSFQHLPDALLDEKLLQSTVSARRLLALGARAGCRQLSR